MHQLVLYGRSGCHLCEDMTLALAEFKRALQFDFVTIDVDSDPELRERYGMLVPVLALDGREICHYFLDLQALRAVLDAREKARSE